MKLILGAESAPFSKLFWSVVTDNGDDSGRRIILIILVVGIQKFATDEQDLVLKQYDAQMKSPVTKVTVIFVHANFALLIIVTAISWLRNYSISWFKLLLILI